MARIRRLAQLMLNRGKGRQNLSLRSNAIMVWNTLRLGEIFEMAERDGKRFSPEAIAQVQPVE